MDAYSMDLRERVVRACDERAGTRRQIAQRFGVSVSWVYRLLQRRRQTGSIAAKAQCHGPRPTFDETRLRQLDQAVRRHPDATLVELRDRLGLHVSQSVIHRALVKLRISLKKDPSSRRTRPARRG